MTVHLFWLKVTYKLSYKQGPTLRCDKFIIVNIIFCIILAVTSCRVLFDRNAATNWERRRLQELLAPVVQAAVAI